MLEIFHEISQNGFMQRAVLALVLSAIACGIVGGYVVMRRGTYMIGAVSHSLLGGIGAALALQAFCRWNWLTPGIGALICAIGVGVIITFMSQKWHVREDTVLSAIWALGMAVGVSCITAVPGYPPDLNGFLFGNVLLISNADIWMMVGLDMVILLAVWLLHQRFVAFSFNSELLELRGVNLFGVALALNILSALTVVILSQLVGLILCMALLVLPVASAALCCRKISGIMTLGGAICALCGFLGLIISYNPLPNGIFLAPGPTIVELAGIVFVVVKLCTLKRK